MTLRPIARPITVPSTIAMASPSATAGSVTPRARRGRPDRRSLAGSPRRCRSAWRHRRARSARTTPSHSSRIDEAGRRCARSVASPTSAGCAGRARGVGARVRARSWLNAASARSASRSSGRSASARRRCRPMIRIDGEHAGGVEVLRRHHDELAEPGGAQEEFGRHHADERRARSPGARRSS